MNNVSKASFRALQEMCAPQRGAFFTALLFLVPAAQAADIPAGELSTAEISAIVRQQAGELAAQRKLIDQQQEALESQRKTIELQQQELAKQQAALSALQSGSTPAPVNAGTAAESPPETAAAGAVPAVGAQPSVPPATGTGSVKATPQDFQERVAKEQDDDPLLGYNPASFPGSIPLPGQNAALRIGGFVKANAVESLETLGTPDRFIVGSISTDSALSGGSEADLTANQSRLNFDLREDTDVGQFRAFIEGDFAGSGDTFRLRHAFGQYGSLLAGRTWTTFMDTEASPEELDFEGINGRINLRHTQFRYFPDIGKDWNMAVAIEQPDLVVGNGTGVSQIPDVVVSAKRTVHTPLTNREWHIKTSGLYRSIRANPDANPDQTDSTKGWGLSVSGSTPLLYWDNRDNVMVQFNYGEGYSSYVNDPSSINLPDVAFNPDTNQLVAIRIFGWYAAFQHWWTDTLRSNWNISQVKVGSEDFLVTDDYGDNYRETWRTSGNIIWSPIPRINVGGELLWGQRVNDDGASGNATQFQFSLKYLF